MAGVDRSEYPAMLATIQPTQAVNILNERVKSIGRINLEIADWLQERRKVEEQYVLGLRKLAKKQPPDPQSDLGIFQDPWRKIVSAADALADSHHNLAQKITIDVESPLREFASGNREMQGLSTVQGNLVSLAKDFDAAQKKVEKSSKGGKLSGSKAANISSEVDSATSAWESQSPFVFESLQAVDETRCNHLRDVLTQFQTHEVDQIERSRKTAESVLNSLLNLETADEIKTFSLKNTGNARRITSRRDSRTSANAATTPRAERSTSESLMPPPPIPVADDRASQRSGSIQEEKKRSLGSGLKRLGTVMGRRRQSAIEPRPTPKKKFSQNDSGLSTMAERPSASRESRDQASPSNAFTPLPPVQLGSTGAFDQVNGDTIEPTDRPSLSTQAPVSQGLQPPLQPLPPLEAQKSADIPPPVPAKDNEGFSVPPPSDDPISQAEREAAAVGLGSDASNPPFKMDIRNAPISEEGNSDTSTAMTNMANTLRAQQAALPKRSPTNRGRRDVRSTLFTPSPPPEGALGQPIVAQPSFASSQRSTGSDTYLPQQLAASKLPDHTRASESVDTQSIRSGRSLSTIGSGAVIKHPDLNAPGLNTSIVETLSAWQEGGGVTRATLNGELAFAFNPTASSPSTTETVRINHFETLEKVFPNPSFVHAVPAKNGEYTINIKAISQPTPIAALKYQALLSEAMLSAQAPLIIRPSWKIEPTQASAIVSYSVNPAFAATLEAPVTLSNVYVALYLDGKASSCQSKPQGTFARERSMVYWKIDDLVITSQTASEEATTKVIARFLTPEGQSQAGRVEAKWELSGTSSLGSGIGVSRLLAPAVGADPFADDDNAGTSMWNDVPLVRKVAAGTFVAT